MKTVFLGFLLAAQASLPVLPAQKIITTALAYKIDPVMALAVLKCESSLKHEGVYGDNGKAYGIAQFHKPTFNGFKIDAEAPYLNYKDQDSQIELFAWAVANGRASHWTCWRKIAPDLG